MEVEVEVADVGVKLGFGFGVDGRDGPRTSAAASLMCWASSRSCAARYGADGGRRRSCSSRSAHKATARPSSASSRASAGTHTGRAGSRASVCGGTVRSFRCTSPRTRRVPTRVAYPLTVSLREVVSANVLPLLEPDDVLVVGSASSEGGVKSAAQSSRPPRSEESVVRSDVRSHSSSRACGRCELLVVRKGKD